jgi:hypothetical protein
VSVPVAGGPADPSGRGSEPAGRADPVTVSVLVFAYGSNLLPARLQARTPLARLLGVAVAPGFRLGFCKRGSDGSGKCYLHADPSASTPGALYLYEGPPALMAAELAELDRIEGVGVGYERVPITVERASPGGSRLTCVAHTYMALPDAVIDGLVPYDWYRDLVLAGARHLGLPSQHCAAIRSVAVRPDPDAGRVAQARSILAGPPVLAGYGSALR